MFAEKAYGSNDLRDLIAAMKAQVVIPPKRNRKVAIPYDVKIDLHPNACLHLAG